MTFETNRVILFDIDGTLVRGSPGRSVFCAAMEEVYGEPGRPELVSFSGKTDPQIAHELLALAGVERERVDALLPEMLARYVELLAEALPDRLPEVLPGIPDLLYRVAAEEGVEMALLTGNVIDGARIKLGSVGLAGFFPFGAFGSDSMDRNELPAIALERARSRWGGHLHPGHMVIVGDTPRDVICGRLAGMETVAVATGQYSLEELADTEADRVFPDLEAPGVYDSLVRGGVRLAGTV